PETLVKLNYCDRTMARLANRDPMVTANELDEDVGELSYSLNQYYQYVPASSLSFPPGLDGDLRAIFEDLGEPEDSSTGAVRKPAAALIHRLERDLQANVYRWTGHFPEHTRVLVRHLADRAQQLNQVYPADREVTATVAFTT